MLVEKKIRFRRNISELDYYLLRHKYKYRGLHIIKIELKKNDSFTSKVSVNVYTWWFWFVVVWLCVLIPYIHCMTHSNSVLHDAWYILYCDLVDIIMWWVVVCACIVVVHGKQDCVEGEWSCQRRGVNLTSSCISLHSPCHGECWERYAWCEESQQCIMARVKCSIMWGVGCGKSSYFC